MVCDYSLPVLSVSRGCRIILDEKTSDQIRSDQIRLDQIRSDQIRSEPGLRLFASRPRCRDGGGFPATCVQILRLECIFHFEIGACALRLVYITLVVWWRFPRSKITAYIF